MLFLSPPLFLLFLLSTSFSRDRDRIREELRTHRLSDSIIPNTFNANIPAGFYRLQLSEPEDRQVAEYLRDLEMERIQQNCIYIALDGYPFNFFTTEDIEFREGFSDYGCQCCKLLSFSFLFLHKFQLYQYMSIDHLKYVNQDLFPTIDLFLPLYSLLSSDRFPPFSCQTLYIVFIFFLLSSLPSLFPDFKH